MSRCDHRDNAWAYDVDSARCISTSTLRVTCRCHPERIPFDFCTDHVGAWVVGLARSSHDIELLALYGDEPDILRSEWERDHPLANAT